MRGGGILWRPPTQLVLDCLSLTRLKIKTVTRQHLLHPHNFHISSLQHANFNGRLTILLLLAGTIAVNILRHTHIYINSQETV